MIISNEMQNTNQKRKKFKRIMRKRRVLILVDNVPDEY